MIRVAVILIALLLAGCASKPSSNDSGNGGLIERGAGGDFIVGSKLDLNLCNTKVSNAPNSIAGRVLRESPRLCLNTQSLLVSPAIGACVTSGYGRRFGKQHHGVDYQAQPAGPIVAAGAGTVVRREYRAKDFGHWIVIDHGAGVYTAYGHLARIQRGVSVGRRVRQGQQLGVMGSTGKSATGVHLHYEVRMGRLSSTASFFSLRSVDPFALPAQCG